jgi:hypothetical protein
MSEWGTHEGNRAEAGVEAPQTLQPKYTEEIDFLVDTSSLRLLLIGVPTSFVALFLGSLVNGPQESTSFHILMASLFAAPASIFLIYQIIKAGYLVLDPKRNRIVISGESISFRHLSNPQIGRHEVEFMSTQWHPMRGTGEGLEIAPGRTILFNTGHSRRKLQKIADILGEMLEEFERKEAARAAQKSADRTSLSAPRSSDGPPAP